MAKSPLNCRLCTWENPSPGPLVSGQVAALLGHTEEKHCGVLPENVREQIRGCKKELEKLPV